MVLVSIHNYHYNCQSNFENELRDPTVEKAYWERIAHYMGINSNSPAFIRREYITLYLCNF